MFQVIKATKNHIDVINSLAHEIWPHAYGSILPEAQLQYMLERFYSSSSLQNQMDHLHHSFIIVKNENEIVGFASYSPHDENPSIFHLNKIYVLPSQQGKNAGIKMLDHIIAEIKKEGANSLQLNVNRHNKAIHFYEKQGFNVIGKEDIDIGKGYFMNDWIMEKKFDAHNKNDLFA